MVQWRKCEACGWWSHRSSHFCAACGKPHQGHSQTKGSNKGKGKGKGKATAAPTAVNVEEQVRKALTKFGAMPASTEHAKSYAETVKGTKNTDIVMGDAENGATTSSKYLDMWQDLTPAQIKAEVQRLEQLAKQMRDLKLTKAETEITQQLEELRAYQRSKMSGGQRIDTLQAAVRRALATQEKTMEQIAELNAKLEEQKQKLAKARQEEIQTTEALEQAKREMVEDKNNNKEVTGMEHTAASAAFATALMPEHLPPEVATFVQIKINDLLAKVQADIQQTVSSALALPPTPRLEETEETQAAPPAALAAAGIQQPMNASQEVARTQIESQSQESGFGKATPQGQTLTTIQSSQTTMGYAVRWASSCRQSSDKTRVPAIAGQGEEIACLSAGFVSYAHAILGLCAGHSGENVWGRHNSKGSLEESSLTGASDKFVSASLPKELPLPQQQVHHIQIKAQWDAHSYRSGYSGSQQALLASLPLQAS